ncbi:MAG TPA: hypothetical protein VEC11_06290 [Allosphingosinicella sp.]|nr:hypothetical protein [Allosphingosinicella sp.]
MRTLLAAALLAITLSACGQRSGSDLRNELGGRQSGLPTPPARPSSDARADLSSDQSFRRNYRTVKIQACVNASRTQSAGNPDIPSGTDFRPYCTCFVDRLMAGLSIDQLINFREGPREEGIAEQCAREHGFALEGAGAEGGDEAAEPAPAGSGGK